MPNIGVINEQGYVVGEGLGFNPIKEDLNKTATESTNKDQQQTEKK